MPLDEGSPAASRASRFSKESSRIPLVTIGMPVRNGAKYLEEAIRSLLAQTEKDFVLHISDNCSDDATPEICARLAAEDARIHHVRQERNLGAAGNFEYLLRAARTPFFMWAADDDLRAPTFLEEALELLHASPDTIGCATAVEFIDEAGNLLYTDSPPAGLADASPVTRARAVRSRGFNAVYALFRRDLLPASIKVEQISAADVAFVFGLALHGRFAITDHVLSTRRVIGYSSVLSPDGRLVWEKALGPDGVLYSRKPYAMCRSMFAYTFAAQIPLWQQIVLSAHVLRAWWLRSLWDEAIRQTSPVRVRHSLHEGRRLHALLLMLGHAVLRPRKAMGEAKRLLGKLLKRA